MSEARRPRSGLFPHTPRLPRPSRARRAVTGVLRALLFLGGLGSASPAHARAAAPQEWADSLHHVTVNGTDLAYIDVGRGDPIVLLHGDMSDYRAWLRVVPELSRRYRVIAYSRRYHFPNQGGGDGRDYTVAMHERDLVSLIAGLGLKSVHLVGHSDGGTLAAWYASHHPDQVRSLVLIEPNLPGLMAGAPKESLFVADRRLVLEQAGMALRDGFYEIGIERLVEWTYGEPGLLAIPRAVQGWMGQNAESLRMQFLAVSPGPRFGRAEATRIGCPVLYVEGDRSPWHARAVGDAFVGCRPTAQRVVLKRVGHGVPWEDPRALDRAVLEFLDRNRLASD